MKKITFLIFLLMAQLGFSQQVLIQDFETAASYTFAGFEGLASASVVADPAAGGTNGNCFKLINQTSGQPWQGAEVILTQKKIKLTTDKTIQISVYSTQAFNMLCKVEVGGPASANGQAYTTPGQWQTLTFNFNAPMDNTGVANGEYEKIVFFGNWKATNDGFDTPQNFAFHVDNITAEEATVTPVPVPTEAAPAPPERLEADVVSIFSDVYTNVTVNEWGPNWGPSSTPITDNPIAGNATKKISMGAGQTFAGISFVSSAFDATSFTHFHVDYWIAAPLPAGQVFNVKLSNHNGGSGETSAVQYTAIPSAGSQWLSLDIPLADFVAASNPANLDRNAIAQIIITGARADTNVPVSIYFDNMYFHKNTLLGTDSFESTKFKMYPNPAQDVLNIVSEEVIQNVSIYNLLGQNVMSVMNDSQNLILNVSNLQDGIYMVRTTTNGIETTQKFIKK
jgi:hypothetical protein